MDVYQSVLLRSSLETPQVTIIIQVKDTNAKSYLVLLREPEHVLHFISHYCLEVCQLVLLIKCTLIVLMVSQIILNSTCWPAMKIAVKLETATYAPSLIWHDCLPHYYLYTRRLYHVLYTVYFVSNHVIAYANVFLL